MSKILPRHVLDWNIQHLSRKPSKIVMIQFTEACQKNRLRYFHTKAQAFWVLEAASNSPTQPILNMNKKHCCRFSTKVSLFIVASASAIHIAISINRFYHPCDTRERQNSVYQFQMLIRLSIALLAAFSGVKRIIIGGFLNWITLKNATESLPWRSMPLKRRKEGKIEKEMVVFWVINSDVMSLFRSVCMVPAFHHLSTAHRSLYHTTMFTLPRWALCTAKPGSFLLNNPQKVVCASR